MKIKQSEIYKELSSSICFINHLDRKEVDYEIVESAILQVSQCFEETSNKWEKVKAVLASLVGYTTQYKELKLEIQKLEKTLIHSNNQTSSQKKNKNIQESTINQSKLNELDLSIKKETIALIKKFNEIDKLIIDVQRQMTGNSPPSVKNAFQELPTGGILPAQGTSLGGIENKNNTCYLASAMQAINAIPSYRRMFDPALKPLKQRPEESDSSYAQRCKIQRQGFKIIKNIATGKTTPLYQINAFRRSCFDFKFQGTPIVDSLDGTADATETLNRLLEAMDYEFEAYEVKEKLNDAEASIVSKDYEKNFNKYTLLEDAKEEKTEKNSIIQLNTFSLLNDGASLQTLIDESWQDEIREGFYKNYDETGVLFVGEYKNLSIVREPIIDRAPEVIRVMLSQDEYHKIALSGIETIYPFGKEKGPQYELKAVIEHRPGHYVAHISNGNKGMIEVNDDHINKKEGLIPGAAYYYVRKDV